MFLSTTSGVSTYVHMCACVRVCVCVHVCLTELISAFARLLILPVTSLLP